MQDLLSFAWQSVSAAVPPDSAVVQISVEESKASPGRWSHISDGNQIIFFLNSQDAATFSVCFQNTVLPPCFLDPLLLAEIRAEERRAACN